MRQAVDLLVIFPNWDGGVSKKWERALSFGRMFAPTRLAIEK